MFSLLASYYMRAKPFVYERTVRQCGLEGFPFRATAEPFRAVRPYCISHELIIFWAALENLENLAVSAV